MANRTTAAAVRGILRDNSPPSDKDIDPFIESANSVVTSVCTNSGYDDAKLEIIERWLSAHFVRVAYSAFKREEIRNSRDEYQSRVEIGFDVTHYGQQAMRIDTAGNLAILNNQVKKADLPLPAEKRSVSIRWLGKRYRSGFRY